MRGNTLGWTSQLVPLMSYTWSHEDHDLALALLICPSPNKVRRCGKEKWRGLGATEGGLTIAS